MYLKFHTIFLVFLFSITCCFSQQAETSVVNELAKTVFTIPEGKITIYTPNFVTNEKISGSIIIEPNGNSEKNRAKNKTKLQNHKVDFGGVSTTLQASHYSISKSQPFPMELKLFDEKNNLIASSKIQFPSSVKEKSSSQFIPSYIVAGEPAKMIVANNGSLAYSYVSINNKDTEILAASETTVFFKTPSDLSGKAPFNYKNDSTNLDEEVNVLQLNLSAGKLNLSRGETTKLNIEVSGLDGLDEEVPITITNKSPSNISLEGGNNQEISIQPDADVYRINQTIRATQGGSFSVSVTIEPPSEDNISEGNDEPLCNCFIDGYSYLISPEACAELGGQCQPDNPETFGTSRRERLGDAVGNYNFTFQMLLSYADDIEDRKDAINDLWDKWRHAEHLKDSLDGLHGELVAIDKVLENVPSTYNEKFKKIIDSLQNLQKKLPNPIDAQALQKAVNDAQARVEACKKRMEDLQKQKEELEEQLKKDKEDLIKDLEYLKNYLDDFNIEVTYSFDEDGKLSYDEDWSNMYKYDRERLENEGDLPSGLKSELYKKRKQYNEKVKKLKALPEAIEAAQKDCDDLADDLEKAKQAKATSDLVAATELQVEDLCAQIRRILGRLWHWCADNPDYCTTSDVDKIRAQCPKTLEELKAFWNDFDALLKKKKGFEDSIAKNAKVAQDEIDKIKDDISDLNNEIAALKEQKRKKQQEDLERKKQAAAAAATEAAEAKAAADKRKKQREKQKKEDDKIKDLIKKAKSSEAGDDAFKGLLKGTGLNLLDEVSGKSKLGTIIGGLLAAKDVPKCTCPILKALRDAIAARNRKENSTISLYVDAYLIEWNKCANLPAISSVPVGSAELTKAIKGMTDAQAEKALKALNQAVRVQCK